MMMMMMSEHKCSKCGYPMRNTKSRLTATLSGVMYRTWICFRCDAYNLQKEDANDDSKSED